MNKRLKIGITGAAGNIGRRLTSGLASCHELFLFDQFIPEGEGDIERLDVSDHAAVAGRFEGLDAVIHLAAAHRGNPPFEAVVRTNIVGTGNVLEEARRARVKRFIFASTNHVQNGWATGEHRSMSAMSADFAASGRQITAADAPMPDSFYGVSKLCCEDLGRYYAQYLGCFSFVALRIGWAAPCRVEDAPLLKIMASAEVERHYRALFMSERDTVALFERALLAEFKFFIGYGTSANPVPIFDLSETIERLGYQPLDNSDDYFGAVRTGFAAAG